MRQEPSAAQTARRVLLPRATPLSAPGDQALAHAAPRPWRVRCRPALQRRAEQAEGSLSYRAPISWSSLFCERFVPTRVPSAPILVQQRVDPADQLSTQPAIGLATRSPL